MILLQIWREVERHVGILQLSGYLEECLLICGCILGFDGDGTEGLKEVEEQDIKVVLHPIRYSDAKCVGSLCIPGLEEVYIAGSEPQPLVPGVLGEKLL